MREKVRQKMDEMNVYKIKFYRHKTPICHNIFTACLFLNDQNVILSRGIAICSVLDPFSKNAGRGIAFARALKALDKQSNSDPIKQRLRWRDKFVRRTLRVKGDEEEEFYKEVVPALKQLNDSFGICPTEVNVRLDNCKDGRVKKTILYKVPRDYPVHETLKMFHHKSEFLPDPTKLEKELLS